MLQSEQLVPLSPAEIALLKTKSRPALGCSVAILVVLALFVFYVLREWIEGRFVTGGGIVDLAVLAIVVIVGALLVLFMLKSRGPLREDVRDGQKRVLIAPMESQREITSERTYQPKGLIGMFFTDYGIKYQYYVKVNGKEYPVSMEVYYELKPGSLVEVHEAPHSGKLLSVSPAKT